MKELAANNNKRFHQTLFNMVRLLTLFSVFFLMLPAIVNADVDPGDESIAIYVPHLKWKLKLPASDWKVVQEKQKKGGSGFYYHLTSEKYSLNFSVFLDKTDKCASPTECRELFWKNPGPKYKNPMGVIKKTVNEFSVIQFYIDKPMGYPVVQSNISAHSYRDGFWVDIHMSKVGKQYPDHHSMNDVLETVTLE